MATADELVIGSLPEPRARAAVKDQAWALVADLDHGAVAREDAEELPGLLQQAETLLAGANEVPLQDLSSEITALLQSTQTAVTTVEELILSAFEPRPCPSKVLTTSLPKLNELTELEQLEHLTCGMSLILML